VVVRLWRRDQGVGRAVVTFHTGACGRGEVLTLAVHTSITRSAVVSFLTSYNRSNISHFYFSDVPLTWAIANAIGQTPKAGAFWSRRS